MTLQDVGELIGKAFPKAFTPAKILSGFQVTGIQPFNSDCFNDDDFLWSSVTDCPDPGNISSYKR